jgi:hypothetical protein
MTAQLRAALHETQTELRDLRAELDATPWLIGALKHISRSLCAFRWGPEEADQHSCACNSCTARGALQRFYERRPILIPPKSP